jgi:[protein-PII] uridylyltransferase
MLEAELTLLPGIAAARDRAERVDSLVAGLSEKLAAVSGSVAVVGLGGYGRRELTPRTDIDLLFLHDAESELSTRWVTEAVCYPLWEQHLRVEPMVRTLAECVAEARRSWPAATSFLDARLVAGNAAVFDEFSRQVTQPWRRDRERLRHRLRGEAERRHATHASAAAAVAPDVVAGRGGLLDLQAVRWLEPAADERLTGALEFLLRTLSAAEELVGQTPHRLSARVQERLAAALGLHGAASFLAELFNHTRWVAFRMDGALAPQRDDRRLGLNLSLRRGELIGERLPPVERVPSLGLRVANLVGLAPPSAELMTWASQPGPPIQWDEATLQQFWLLLRAADWRAWDFLDVSGLMLRYLPELAEVSRRGSDDLALDSHSFQALRRLHEWTESDDPLAERAWRPLRRRDWLYLTVLLHELSADSARAAADRLGLPAEAGVALGFAVADHRLLGETATRRDLHDEDLLLELATRIRTRQRLSLVFLVAAAHDLASGRAAWTPWKADLMRQLFSRLEAALHQSGEVGLRRTRSLDQHRASIVHELERRKLKTLLPLVARLPRRYVLARSPAFVARHLGVLGERRLADGEVRMQAYRHRQPGLWEVLVVARDRPGLLATVAGVLAMRGTSVLAADAATCADGLVLDVFTVVGAYGAALSRDLWPAVADDVRSAIEGRLPLRDLLGARPLPPDEAEAIHVSVDNAASQFFSVVEVRAADRVGLLYRIAAGLHELGLDIHHARIATHPEGALDVFYVWDLSGEKLDEAHTQRVAHDLAAWLRGDVTVGTPPG